jgi:triacylglycerol lipase
MMRQEAFAVGELAALQRDPAYFGVGLPRGDGRLVLVVPGLFGNDAYLRPLHTWLFRLGYRPVPSTLLVNAGCPQRLRTEVEAALRRRMTRNGPVALVGHSRGGVLAWAIASGLGERASHLALLASPAAATVAMFRAGNWRPPAASPVAQAGQRALELLDPDCKVPDCGCAYPHDLRQPLNPATKVLAVYSRDDPVVAPTACHVEGAENHEVGGTHSGMVYNRAAYPVLARFLAR